MLDNNFPGDKRTMLLSLVVMATLVRTAGGQMRFPTHFYLCNFDGDQNQSNVDYGEISLSVAIDGNPEFFVPGKDYQGRQS